MLKQALTLDRTKRLSSGWKSEISFPFDDSSIYRIAQHYLDCLPSVKQYPKIPTDELLSLLEEEGFSQIFKFDSFREKENNKHHYIYYHATGLVLSVIFREDDAQDYYDIEDIINKFEKTCSLEIATVTLFYVTEEEIYKKINSELERLGSLDLKKAAKKNHINFLCYDSYYRLKTVKIDRKLNSNLELNYGPEFLDVSNKLVNFLDSDESGLVLLFGGVGTGKTSFLRYLLSIVNKKTIYIPPHMVSRISEPDFLSFLLKHEDFNLIIEDAEEVVTNRRDTVNAAGVSNLLNLSDGILGDCIKARVICSFNTDIKNIDPALTRKGRLKLSYEFKKLSPDLAKKLLESLGIDFEPTEPMSLAEIYNISSDSFHSHFQKKKIVGFASG